MTERVWMPVETVDDGDAGDFERRCAELVKRGYVLSSSCCGHADASYDFCHIWLAIFVLPEVKGAQ